MVNSNLNLVCDRLIEWKNKFDKFDLFLLCPRRSIETTIGPTYNRGIRKVSGNFDKVSVRLTVQDYSVLNLYGKMYQANFIFYVRICILYYLPKNYYPWLMSLGYCLSLVQTLKLTWAGYGQARLHFLGARLYVSGYCQTRPHSLGAQLFVFWLLEQLF